MTTKTESGPSYASCRVHFPDKKDLARIAKAAARENMSVSTFMRRAGIEAEEASRKKGRAA